MRLDVPGPTAGPTRVFLSCHAAYAAAGLIASSAAETDASAASMPTIIAPTPMGSSLPMFLAARNAGRMGSSARGMARARISSARRRTCVSGTL